MGPYDDMVGELVPGQTGWLPLGDDGEPTGPATQFPPPPPALACSVKASTPEEIAAGNDAIVSSTGAPLKGPLTSNVDKRDPDTWVAPTPPVIISLTPNTAECGSADLEMKVTGTGFTPDSVIVFNGHDEPTDFFSETEIGTGVKPSLFTVAATCPIFIRNLGGSSNVAEFTFTAPAGRVSGNHSGRRTS